jgi:hypothetical protein
VNGSCVHLLMAGGHKSVPLDVSGDQMLCDLKSAVLLMGSIPTPPTTTGIWSAPIWYTSGYIRDPAFIVAYSVGAL